MIIWSFQVPFMAGAFGTDEYQAVIEEMLFTKYSARPHWGKNNRLSSNRVKKLYPDFSKWQKVFRLFNKDGTFCNEFTRRMGFDDCLGEECDQHNHAYDDVVSVQPN
jgi:hypothetical protein